MQQTTSRSFLTSLNIIYLSITAVPGLFALVVIYLKMTGAILPDPAGAERVQTILYSSIPAGIIGSLVIYKLGLNAIPSALNLRGKITDLQAVVLKRAACLEIPALSGAMTAFLSGELAFLLSTASMIILLIYFRPTATSIANDLELSETDRGILMSPDAAID